MDNNTIFRGIKATFDCSDWQQVETIGNFWERAASIVPWIDLVGLGCNWTADGRYFDYALGTIEDNSELVEALASIDFASLSLETTPCEITLPPLSDPKWETFSGKDSEVKEIYERADCYHRKYDYELEYLDGKGNFSTMIHFIEPKCS